MGVAIAVVASVLMGVVAAADESGGRVVAVTDATEGGG